MKHYYSEESITIDDIVYNYCGTNFGINEFIYDWYDYCSEEPDLEVIYEDEHGTELVLYVLNGEIICKFINVD